ncbi:MAG: hypothetical protein SGJ20_17620 [Planctomycetota bacterium]|nr:hypothetical protein [Planctomycetota bacterium]
MPTRIIALALLLPALLLGTAQTKDIPTPASQKQPASGNARIAQQTAQVADSKAKARVAKKAPVPKSVTKAIAAKGKPLHIHAPTVLGTTNTSPLVSPTASVTKHPAKAAGQSPALSHNHWLWKWLKHLRKPAGHSKPVVPKDPRPDPNPDEPSTDPVTPEPPTDPEKPTDPVTPEKPVDPDPVTPEEPTTPEDPSDPVTPEEPTDPVTPEGPADPVTPEVPTDPVTPEEPTTDPVTPEEPTDPVVPEEPTVPVTPEEPTYPAPQVPVVPSTKKPITSADLKLVGGWRVPQTHRPELRLTMAYTPGGLATDGRRVFALHNDGVQEYSAPVMGVGPEYNKWPELVPGNYSPDIYTPAREANKAYAAPQPFGLALIDSKLHVTGRALYAAPPPLAAYITREGDPAAYMPGGSTAQKNGGGICVIPESFATRHLQGKRLAIGFGGSTSGQGYTAGPSLIAAASIDDPKPIDLIGFGKFDTQDPNLRERRPPDYKKGIEWILAPSSDVGYWGLDKIKAGPCWIETPTRHGVLYWSTQGTGMLSYGPQGEAGGENKLNKQRLYVYDPDQIGGVAAGLLRPYQMRGKFYEWADCTSIPSVGGEGTTMRGEVVGACWYANRLYLLHRWITDGQFESYPVVAVYEIAE